MQHNAKSFIHHSMLILGMLMLASCSLIYDYFPEEDDPLEDDYCFVTLTLRTYSPATRAAQTIGGGEYDDGTDTDYENFIDIDRGDFRFYLFRADDEQPENETFITEVSVDSHFLVPESDGYSSSSYRIIGKVDPSLFEGITAYKAVFVCNWGKNGDTPNYPDLTPGSSTITDVQATYNYTSDWRLGINLIPMFGITNTLYRSNPDYDIQADYRTNIGTIHLLRSMAKIEVCVSDNETSDIESVELIGFNTTGYCAPSDIRRQADYFGTDYVYADNYIKAPSLVNSDGGNTAGATGNSRYFPFTEATASSHRIFTLYVPEYRNEKADRSLTEDAACLKIRFADGDDLEYTLNFTTTSDGVPYSGYTKGDAFNLLRNSYYKYTVRRTDNRDLEVEVHPYYSEDLNPDFGIETGTIIWEGMWSVTSAIIGTNAMNDLKQLLYDWSSVPAGTTLTLFLLSRELEGIGDNDFDNQCMVQLQRFNTSGSESKQIMGLEEKYYRPENGILTIPLSQETLDDIIAHGGLSITGQYFILYRVTLR